MVGRNYGEGEGRGVIPLLWEPQVMGRIRAYAAFYPGGGAQSLLPPPTHLKVKIKPEEQIKNLVRQN